MLRRVLSFLTVAGSLTVACSGKNPYDPGEKVGAFHVSAKLTQSTCGQPPNPWEFDVNVNRDGSTVYWIQGAYPVSGEVDKNAHTTLTASVTNVVREAEKKRAECSIARADVLDMVLTDASSKPAIDPANVTSFAGTISYTFVPTAGSSCEDQLTSTGGGYDALPCSVTYSLTATLTKAAR